MGDQYFRSRTNPSTQGDLHTLQVKSEDFAFPYALGALAIHRGLEQAEEDRVWRVRGRTQLGLIQRADEERVVGPLDSADFMGDIAGRHQHAVATGEVLQLGGEAVIAGGALFGGQGAAIERGEARTWREFDLDVLVHQGARQQRDYGCATNLAVLGVDAVPHAAKRAGMFYQNMLESTSSADEWDALLAGCLDHTVHRVRIVVRRARSDHDRSVIGEVIRNCGCWQHARRGVHAKCTGSVLDCGECGSVICLRWREIDQHSDTQHL